jgi:hypothetical protein
VKHEIKLKPFKTPNFALVEGAETTIPLADLSTQTLDAMCTQFRLDVFAKAGKPCIVTERVGPPTLPTP